MIEEAGGMVHGMLTAVTGIRKILFQFVNTAVSQSGFVTKSNNIFFFFFFFFTAIEFPLGGSSPYTSNKYE
jgi:hypothetical protein